MRTGGPDRCAQQCIPRPGPARQGATSALLNHRGAPTTTAIGHRRTMGRRMLPSTRTGTPDNTDPDHPGPKPGQTGCARRGFWFARGDGLAVRRVCGAGRAATGPLWCGRWFAVDLSDVAVGCRAASGGGFQEPEKQHSPLGGAAPVETEYELVQAGLEVFGPHTPWQVSSRIRLTRDNSRCAPGRKVCAGSPAALEDGLESANERLVHLGLPESRSWVAGPMRCGTLCSVVHAPWQPPTPVMLCTVRAERPCVDTVFNQAASNHTASGPASLRTPSRP